MDSIVSKSGFVITENSFSGLMSKVFNWMTVGLAVTGLAAYFVSSNEAVTEYVFSNMPLIFGLIIAELILVLVISTTVNKISYGVSLTLFLLYSLINGVTLSCIFMLYTTASITSAFLVTAGTFLAMSLYGYVTKKNLTSIGSFCIMGLFGIIIAGIVNFFLRSDMMSFVITVIGVIVFVGLTAYDTQKIKLRLMDAASEEDFSRISVYGALVLYLDFVNLFLRILKLMGKKK